MITPRRQQGARRPAWAPPAAALVSNGNKSTVVRLLSSQPRWGPRATVHLWRTGRVCLIRPASGRFDSPESGATGRLQPSHTISHQRSGWNPRRPPASSTAPPPPVSPPARGMAERPEYTGAPLPPNESERWNYLCSLNVLDTVRQWLDASPARPCSLARQRPLLLCRRPADACQCPRWTQEPEQKFDDITRLCCMVFKVRTGRGVGADDGLPARPCERPRCVVARR